MSSCLYSVIERFSRVIGGLQKRESEERISSQFAFWETGRELSEDFNCDHSTLDRREVLSQ